MTLLYVSLLFLLAPALAQQCSQPGYDTDAACFHGEGAFCDGARCLYETCAKGYYATQVFDVQVYYGRTANLCTACPGRWQTTDVSVDSPYGIGECYIPCGKSKCYVPSYGGRSHGAHQKGENICVSARKGVCEATCNDEGSTPMPDAYTPGNACHSQQWKHRTGAMVLHSRPPLRDGQKSKLPDEEYYDEGPWVAPYDVASEAQAMVVKDDDWF